MKIVKPSWVNYKGEPIISIHFHPDGRRFATGGVLNDSGQVSIWSTKSFENQSTVSNGEGDLPKLLCQMSNHHGCVNCVRWNHGGNWLASAGVDKGVIIWQLRSLSNQNDNFNIAGVGQYSETWSCVYILRGHTGYRLSKLISVFLLWTFLHLIQLIYYTVDISHFLSHNYSSVRLIAIALLAIFV